ncbi:MAG: GAF domain-containing protein [Gemmatimonadetes bacterium]|nr:MAG: GAF domain-containing protein [Gemmatimonadota bacterium]
MIENVKQKQQELATLTDSVEKVDLLKEISEYFQRKDPLQALQYATQAAEIAGRIGYDSGYAEAIFLQGKHQNNLGQYVESMKLLKQALSLFETLNDRTGYIKALNLKGMVNYRLGDFQDALVDLTEVLKSEEDIDDKSIRASALNTMGNIYSDLDDYDNALKYYQEGLEKFRETGDRNGEASILNNLGILYSDLGAYEKSLSHYLACLKIREEQEDPRGIAITLLNIGDLYMKQGEFGKALACHHNALDINTGIGNKAVEAHINGSIGKLWVKQEKWEKAIPYLEKATELAAEVEDRNLRVQTLKNLASAHEALGNMSDALSYFKMCYQIEKKAFDEEYKERIDYLKNRYEAEKKEKEAEIYRLKNVELARLYDHIRLISEIGQKITASLSLETILTTVYENINQLMKADGFGIDLYHPETEEIEYKFFIERGERLKPLTGSVHDEGSFSAWAIRNRKEVFLNDATQEYMAYIPKLKAVGADEGGETLSALYVPLIVEDRVVGVVTVQSFDPGAYTPADLDMLRALGNYIAVALDNARAYAELNKAIDDLKTAEVQMLQSERMASLGELSSMIGHEFNNILNGISSPVELIMSQPPLDEDVIWHCWESDQEGHELQAYLEERRQVWEKIREASKMIKLASDRAFETIRDLQAIAGGKSRKLGLTDIVETLEETIRLQRHKLHKIEIVKEIEAEQFRVMITSGEMGQIFMNFLVNAAHALEGQEDARITIRMRQQDGGVEIQFADNGKGMSEEVQKRIFEPFFTTKGEKGTGIGLTMVKRIVDQRGGKITVESQEGEGTTFTIWFPQEIQELSKHHGN